MSINFKTMKTPEQGLRYVKPGFWKLAPVSAELVKAEKEGKHDYISITFEGDAGKLVDKFYLSEKAGFRLKDLHKALYNKDLEKEFATSEEVALYFNTLFGKKKVDLNLVVGGERATNGKVYARLHPFNFVAKDENFTEGELQEGSALWKDLVKENTSGPGTTSPIVGGANTAPEGGDWPF